jgi:Cu/Ag efflux pump CusA
MTSRADRPSRHGYVAAARRAVSANVRIPAGPTVQWSGQYERMVHSSKYSVDDCKNSDKHEH